MVLNVKTKNAESFVSKEDLDALLPELNSAHSKLVEKTGAGSDFTGWVTLPQDYDRDEFARIKASAAKIRSDSKVLVVIGIGGSYLGAKAAIEMLEKFLHAGFDCENAVKLINSSLLLRGEKDTFATLDICDIDFDSATMNFTKLGAAGAYIKTKDKITHISGSSLPAGILKDPKAEMHMLAIDSDTVIVMMSDGIADIALKNPEHEGWIEKEILALDSSNPQIIAGKLLESAIRLTGRTVHDDMTLLVACITKS